MNRRWKHRLSNINPETKEAFCAKCGVVKVSKKDGRWKCTIARQEHRGADFSSDYWKDHPKNIHRQQERQKRKKKPRFAKLMGSSCEICKTTCNLCGDHDHKTGKFRGTLCRSCNSGIGFFKDQTALLAEAISYLSR